MTRSPAPRLLGLAAIGLAGVATACTAADEPAESGSNSTDNGASTEAGTGSGGDTGATGAYTAGEYTAEGSYSTPGGTEKLKVSVTLEADGTLADVTVTPEGVSPNSKQFQGQFAEGIGAVAIGKNIATLSVDKVAGSSLSSGGFNSALEAIAESAQA